MPIAIACANIALVKYWGKRDAFLNLPEAASLSLTLAELRTATEVAPYDGPDTLTIDDRPGDERELRRVSAFLDLIAPGRSGARVTSQTTFPIASGLASSAAGFAALAAAGARAYGQTLEPAALSVLARRGSGSAARSILPGFAKMLRGEREDGADAFAVSVPSALELGAAIAVVRAGPKAVGSTEGMNHTQRTSPFHAAFLAQVDRDVPQAERLLAAGDFTGLAEVVEGSCLAMHANAMAARPGLVYFAPATLWAIAAVRALRAAGTPVMFTIDAGPHVVAFAPPEHLVTVAARLSEHPDVARVIVSRAGPGVSFVEEWADVQRAG